MNVKLAAVIEPNSARYKAIAAGLKKAGLRVSATRDVEEIGGEGLVVVGSVPSPTKAAQRVRARAPQAWLLAALAKGFKAPWADGVLPLPVSASDLRARLLDRQPDTASRPGAGILDPSTSFYTFAHFKEVLFVEVKRARRYGFPLALALVAFDPVDGRLTTDLLTQLMAGLALSIRRSLRDTDYPVQYSGERVLLLMPHTDLAGSLIVARRICERVAKVALPSGDGVLHPTISVGVAAGAPGREYNFSDLVRQAHEGLTAAMARGGNRVEFLDASAGHTDTIDDDGIPRIPPLVPLP